MLIGKSKAIQEISEIISKIADKNVSVLIQGESGTGKEIVAKTIHLSSHRRDKNFFSENCASIPDSLLENELFGHNKGAFTGAYADKKGLFEMANHGTLFLDEIGDMSPNMQASLLRVLETNLIRRISGKEAISIDVRIISASNKDLKELVKKGQFRQDLFFRLKVIEIEIPPLRQRKEDIPLLVEHFFREFSQENACPMPSISTKGMDILKSYDWPGNVRELRNTIQNALILYEDQELEEFHFKEIQALHKKNPLPHEELSIEEYAHYFVVSNQNKYNDSQLAKILGFSRKTLWEKRKKWGLFRKNFL
jgi:DNA-binding NtrC family response regulator